MATAALTLPTSVQGGHSNDAERAYLSSCEELGCVPLSAVIQQLQLAELDLSYVRLSAAGRRAECSLPAKSAVRCLSGFACRH